MNLSLCASRFHIESTIHSRIHHITSVYYVGRHFYTSKIFSRCSEQMKIIHRNRTTHFYRNYVLADSECPHRKSLERNFGSPKQTVVIGLFFFGEPNIIHLQYLFRNSVLNQQYLREFRIDQLSLLIHYVFNDLTLNSLSFFISLNHLLLSPVISIT